MGAAVKISDQHGHMVEVKELNIELKKLFGQYHRINESLQFQKERSVKDFSTIQFLTRHKRFLQSLIQEFLDS